MQSCCLRHHPHRHTQNPTSSTLNAGPTAVSALLQFVQLPTWVMHMNCNMPYINFIRHQHKHRTLFKLIKPGDLIALQLKVAGAVGSEVGLRFAMPWAPCPMHPLPCCAVLRWVM